VILINIRAFKTDVRTKVLSAIKRIIKHEALASGAEKEPEITTINQYPPTINDDASAQKLQAAFEGYFGKEKTVEASRSTASEFWDFGGVHVEEWNDAMKKDGDGNRGKRLAQPHQADYAPVIEPTLRTGIEAMIIAALTFLGTP
jgi:metal-dependent amidase/aminoacylase/carboxypeptidase family protein